MPTLPHRSDPLNPHARRMADLLSSFTALCDMGSLDVAGAILLLAWDEHGHWPLDLDAELRGSALCALADAERALVACRAVDHYLDAGEVCEVEGWLAPTEVAA